MTQERSGRPSEKERKYDRQLRLWAASGQAALESASVLLVNSGSGTVGVETLKNLVLPGVGGFSIFDDAIVEEADLGVNFFLDESSLGKPRAQCCAELLSELNPEVQSSWYPQPSGPATLEEVLESQPTFTTVIFTFPISPQRLALLEAYGTKQSVPLVSVHSAGLYSYFRVVLPKPLTIIDTHPPEESIIDLRLLSPWPELSSFAQELTKNIDSLNDHEHGHLPFIVILLHYLEGWKASHDGKPPSTYADKVAFRKLVTAAARTNNAEGGEENFEEAAAAVLRGLAPPQLPANLKEAFEFEETNPSDAKGSFWIIVRAIRKFYEAHSCLPLPGNMPDLKAESSVYIKLQNIYKAKARKDAAEVLEIVRAIPGGDTVDPAEVDMFCKNAAFVKFIVPPNREADVLAKTAAQEFEKDEMAELTATPLSLFPIFLALQATAHAPDATAEQILQNMEKVVPGAVANERLSKAAEEVARAKGGELHNISSFTGGLVAQEVIKIITRQYVPIDNTCIYDGIESRCQILRI